MKSLLLCLLFGHAALASTPIRGVHPSMAPMYALNAQSTFSCLDGSQTIPFNRVNDDYCDCADGSDEPGTAACENNRFYCANEGHRPMQLLSSRVNDGICDCCDGTDEWGMVNAPCANTCEEQGREAREKLQRLQAIQKEGLAKKSELQQRGKELKAEKLKSIEQYEIELEQVLKEQEEKEAVKNEVEEREKVLLEVFREARDKEREEREAAEKKLDEARAEETFAEVDTNGDGQLQRAEILAYWMFDQNGDGSVSEEEATFFVGDAAEYSKEDFHSSMWVLIKHKKPKNGEEEPQEDETTATPPTEMEPPPVGTGTVSDDYDGDYDDEKPYYAGEDEEDDDLHAPEDDDTYEDLAADEQAHVNRASSDNKSEYDPETKAVVDEADAARQQYEEARRRARELEDKISDTKSSVETDYGIAEEYATLKDECFEFTDNEYTYKHCVFDHCSQKPKHGGGETKLGKFERWIHEDDIGGRRYRGIQYSGGQGCWNGPARSSKVLFECGLESKLISTTEPSKCEYEMVFETPAACVPGPVDQGLRHDEL